MNIVEHFFDCFETRKDGLEHLNAKLNRNFKHNVISRWLNPDDEREPTGRVYEAMIEHVFSEKGRHCDTPRQFYNMLKLPDSNLQ